MKKQQSPQELIKAWNLNKMLFASKMGTNAYTFKMKLLGTYPSYKFTEQEIDKMKEVLKELAAEIQASCQ
jgi:hypothetical protein